MRVIVSIFLSLFFFLFFFPILEFTKGIQVELGIALDYGDRRVGIDFPSWHFLFIFYSIPENRVEILPLDEMIWQKRDRAEQNSGGTPKRNERRRQCAIYPIFFF